MTTASQLIKNSYILAKIIDANEEISGYYASQGLHVLNTIIDECNSLSIYIPSSSIKTFDTIVGTYQYTSSPAITQFLQGNIIDQYNTQSVLFLADLKEQNTFNYSLSSSAPGRPYYVYIQNDQLISGVIQQNSTIFLYPAPDQIYSVTLYVTARLQQFTQSAQILNIPPYYFKFLEYQMAKELSIRFSSILDQNFYDEYEKVMKNMKAANKHDLTVQTNNELRSTRRFRPWGYYYG